ncbi:endo alpha-1,4 polygalactosaminidase [Streptomyces sp. NPDC002928]|uniref:endo alpha-1,4 polygalactosaminidase n=1 Tax=Streptomyces sp. NPDC002928 TaxID=3154440 RepID=UPI0033A2C285
MSAFRCRVSAILLMAARPAGRLRYNCLIAQLAHERGMSVGPKNDLDQMPDLADDFDFAVDERSMSGQRAVNEQCAESRRLKLSSCSRSANGGRGVAPAEPEPGHRGTAQLRHEHPPIAITCPCTAEQISDRATG